MSKKQTKFKLLFLVLVGFLTLTGISCGGATTSSDLGVFKSTDGGATFEQKVKVDEETNIASLPVLTLTQDPYDPNTIYLGSEGKGVYITNDGAETWRRSSLEVGNFYAISVDPKNNSVIYAAGDQGNFGKIFKSEDRGENWTEMYAETHDGTPVQGLTIDFYDSRKIYAGTAAGAVLKSVDGGRSWVVKVWLEDEITKVVMNPNDSRHLIVATDSDGIQKTVDGGETWIDLSAGLKEFDHARRVTDVVYDKNVPGRVYLGSRYGLTRSENEGQTWTGIDLLVQPGETSVMKVALNPIDSKIIYLGLDNTLYKSVDLGGSWTVKKIGGKYIGSVVVDFAQPSTLFVGIQK